MTTPPDSLPPIEDFAAFLEVVAFALGADPDPTISVDSSLGDAGLDSLGLLLISVRLGERGAELTDDDWVGLRTVGDLWERACFRRAHPAPPG